MSHTIDYYHFLLSPWSYMAIDRFNALCARHNVSVNYKPIAVMETFEKMGGTPPAKRHPSRMRFRSDEMKRWSKRLNLPINLSPAHWPVDQSLAAQMVYAAGGSDTNPDAGRLSDALLTAVWKEEKNISDESTLVSLADQCGLKGQELIEMAKDTKYSDLYAATTNEAHERDVFGSPSYVVGDEIFWGQDRLDFLEEALS